MKTFYMFQPFQKFSENWILGYPKMENFYPVLHANFRITPPHFPHPRPHLAPKALGLFYLVGWPILGEFLVQVDLGNECKNLEILKIPKI